MTPQEANKKYGATHYQVMLDGKTPQMYYKQMHIGYADKTSKIVWHYLSYANIWMGSCLPEDLIAELKEIK